MTLPSKAAMEIAQALDDKFAMPIPVDEIASLIDEHPQTKKTLHIASRVAACCDHPLFDWSKATEEHPFPEENACGECGLCQLRAILVNWQPQPEKEG